MSGQEKTIWAFNRFDVAQGISRALGDGLQARVFGGLFMINGNKLRRCGCHMKSGLSMRIQLAYDFMVPRSHA